MKPAIGQVWQDSSDNVLFVTEVSHADDRIKVTGTAIMSGVVVSYTEYSSPDECRFGRLVFNPAGNVRLWLDRAHATV